jgi:hypothetical protein
MATISLAVTLVYQGRRDGAARYLDAAEAATVEWDDPDRS